MADETWDTFIEEAKDVFTLLPEDEYDFIITSAEGKVSKTGNPMIRVSAKVASGPHHGKAIKDFYVMRLTSSPTWIKKFVQHMQAMGIDMSLIAQQKPTMQQIAKVMEGKPFRGKVRHTSDENYGDDVELSWAMKPPTGGAVAVTSFPALSEAESLGYGSGETVATADDAAF